MEKKLIQRQFFVHELFFGLEKGYIYFKVTTILLPSILSNIIVVTISGGQLSGNVFSMPLHQRTEEMTFTINTVVMSTDLT